MSVRAVADLSSVIVTTAGGVRAWQDAYKAVLTVNLYSSVRYIALSVVGDLQGADDKYVLSAGRVEATAPPRQPAPPGKYDPTVLRTRVDSLRQPARCRRN